MKKHLIAAAVATALVATLAACTSAPSGPVESTATPTTASKSTPTPTPTPTPTVGTRANPFPANTGGQYASDSMWTVTVTGTNGNAWADVQKVNPYNETPQDGYSDVIGSLTVGAGQSAPDEGADPGISLTVNYVGTDGNSYEGINHPCGVLADTELQDAGTMFAGASRAVLVCAQVPSSAVEGGTWSVAYSGDASQIAFFAGA